MRNGIQERGMGGKGIKSWIKAKEKGLEIRKEKNISILHISSTLKPRWKITSRTLIILDKLCQQYFSLPIPLSLSTVSLPTPASNMLLQQQLQLAWPHVSSPASSVPTAVATWPPSLAAQHPLLNGGSVITKTNSQLSPLHSSSSCSYHIAKMSICFVKFELRTVTYRHSICQKYIFFREQTVFL